MEETQTAAPAPAESVLPPEPAGTVQGSPVPDAAFDADQSITFSKVSTAGEPQTVQDFIAEGLKEIYAPEPAEPAAEPVEEAAPGQVTDAPEETQSGEPEEPANLESEPAESDRIAQTLAEKPVIFSDAEIDEKFNRVPREIRNLAKTYAAEARRGRELTEKLGGEAYLEPLVKIAEGIKTGQNMGVFEGYLAASGVDGFTDLLDDALTLAMVHIAQGEPQTEGERMLKEQTTAILDSALRARFGENADAAAIDELLKYQREGYLDVNAIRGYFEDSEESENPLITRQKQEIERLKAQLSERETSESAAKKDKENLVLEQFTTGTNNALNSVLDKMVFAKSAINQLPGDTPELKNGKTAAKELLNSFIQHEMQNSKEYRELQQSFSRGEANTANYRTRLTSLIETAMLNAREMAARLEGAFAVPVVNSRNNTLLEAQEKDLKTEKSEPTETTKVDPARMSDDDYRAYLSQQIAAVSRR